MKKITVADIIESVNVSVDPATVKEGHVCRIYKLKMKLHIPIHYPVHTDVTLEDWEETLRVGFVRGLEDAIQSHIVLLGKISGIKDYKDKPNSSNGVKNDHNNESESNRNDQTDDDDDGDADDTEDAEDLGLDAQKNKQQTMDEVEYEDGSEEETRDGQDDEDDKDGKDGKGDGDDSNIEVNGDDSDIDVNDNDKNVALDANNSQGLEETSKSKKRKSEAEFKDNDRRIYVKARGMRFEIHFKFTDDEPHILLAQVLSNANHFLFSSDLLFK
jgi:DNA-directed RNA polymerase I subunit RPA1